MGRVTRSLLVACMCVRVGSDDEECGRLSSCEHQQWIRIPVVGTCKSPGNICCRPTNDNMNTHCQHMYDRPGCSFIKASSAHKVCLRVVVKVKHPHTDVLLQSLRARQTTDSHNCHNGTRTRVSSHHLHANHSTPVNIKIVYVHLPTVPTRPRTISPSGISTASPKSDMRT